MKEDKLLETLNAMLTKKGKPNLGNLDTGLLLMDDLGFDSLELAELTVRLEDEFGVDVFENGLVKSVGEVLEKL